MAQTEAMPPTNGATSLSSDASIPATVDQSISADEIALYDRQIRLWGVQAQENIRKANVLLIRAKALANEVAKNLVLAGIHSITIIDHEIVTEDDLGAQFFVNDASIGKNRAEAALPEVQKLNPRVKVTADKDHIIIKPDLGAYVAPFDLVIATDLDSMTADMVSAACNIRQKPYYIAGTHGMYGYIFADLLKHTYTIEREVSNAPMKTGKETNTRSILSVQASDKKQNGKAMETVLKLETYTPLILANTSPLPPEIRDKKRKLKMVTPLLSCLRALWEFQKQNNRLPTPTPQDLKDYTTRATEKHRELQLPVETLKAEFLRSFIQNLGSELSPVVATLGGMLAQDAINVLGKREQPIQNFVLFDGEEYQAPMYCLQPIFDDGLDAMMQAGMPVPDANGMVVEGGMMGATVMDMDTSGMAAGSSNSMTMAGASGTVPTEGETANGAHSSMLLPHP